jgi:hypothetical protein
MQINNLGDLEMLLYVDLIEMGRVVSEGWGRGRRMSPLTGREQRKETSREPSAFNQTFYGKDGFDSFTVHAAITG